MQGSLLQRASLLLQKIVEISLFIGSVGHMSHEDDSYLRYSTIPGDGGSTHL
jgi:hypothetical protein